MVIVVPDWALIGNVILVKDTERKRGSNPDQWYKEKIIAYGNNGIFHQSIYGDSTICYREFTEYNVTIKSIKLGE